THHASGDGVHDRARRMAEYRAQGPALSHDGPVRRGVLRVRHDSGRCHDREVGTTHATVGRGKRSDSALRLEAQSRASGRRAFDQVRDRVLVRPWPCFDCSTSGLYVLELAGTPTWSIPAVQGTPPAPRAYASAVYDPVRDRMLFYGGVNFGRVFPGPQIPPTI